MRTNEERIEALHKRARELEQKNRIRKRRIIQALSMAACLSLVVILAFLMPGILQKTASEAPDAGMNASIFSSGGTAGYIVLGIVAFLAGVFVTIFCFRLKDAQNERDQEDEL